MMTISDVDFQRVVLFVREKYGINLEHKRQLIDARLSFDLCRQGYNSFSQYINRVIERPDGEECRRMMNKLSTNYTYFFRETDYIPHLCETVLPEFSTQNRTSIQIWSAACSSGQEAYSIAMVLEQQKHFYELPFDYKITGTDINTETLDAAALGVYPDSELNNIPNRYRPFVLPHGNGKIEVAEKLRKKVTWAYRNLLSTQEEPTRFDLIFCRNVMIYFTPQLRREMTAKLYAALLPGGYLYTGTTESIDLERKYFCYIAPAIYQRAGAGGKGTLYGGTAENTGSTV